MYNKKGTSKKSLKSKSQMTPKSGSVLFLSSSKELLNKCPIHVVTFTLISNLATDYIQKRRGEPGLFSFEYNLSPKLISK